MLKGDNNPQLAFFRAEVNLSGPCRKLLGRVKNPFEMQMTHD